MREIKLINRIRKCAGNPGQGVKVGIGDDCAVLKYNKTEYLLWAQDMLVEGTHFTSGKDPYNKIGRKAVAVNISDIAAMGGVPEYITVSMGLPPKISERNIKSISDGIFSVCKKYNIKVIGGDTVRARQLVLDVSIMGKVKKKSLVKRSGAKTGDVIMITGPVRNGKKDHLAFEPRLKEAQYLTKNFKINSMIDVSDGIAMDISRLCMESKKGCMIYSDKIPLSKGLSLKDSLNYGESFELLFTVSPRTASKLLNRKASPYKFYDIGRIHSKKQDLKITTPKGHASALKPSPYKHI